MRPFVELNAKLRAESTNPFYKGVYKLITNSAYGRLIMAKRKQREVRIVTTDRALQKLIRQPRFADYVIISTQRSSCSHAQEVCQIERTHICGYDYTGALESAHVQLLLQRSV